MSRDVLVALALAACAILTGTVAIRQLVATSRVQREFRTRLERVPPKLRSHDYAAVDPNALTLEFSSPTPFRGYPEPQIFEALDIVVQRVYIQRLEDRVRNSRAMQSTVSAVSSALFGVALVPLWPRMFQAFHGVRGGAMELVTIPLASAGSALLLLVLAMVPWGASILGNADRSRAARLLRAYGVPLPERGLLDE